MANRAHPRDACRTNWARRGARCRDGDQGGDPRVRDHRSAEAQAPHRGADGIKGLDSSFMFRSYPQMEIEDLPFKLVKVHGAHDEVIARIGNLLISRAAFEKALFVYPQDHLELRQG